MKEMEHEELSAVILIEPLSPRVKKTDDLSSLMNSTECRSLFKKLLLFFNHCAFFMFIPLFYTFFLLMEGEKAKIVI